MLPGFTGLVSNLDKETLLRSKLNVQGPGQRFSVRRVTLLRDYLKEVEVGSSNLHDEWTFRTLLRFASFGTLGNRIDWFVISWRDYELMNRWEINTAYGRWN